MLPCPARQTDSPDPALWLNRAARPHRYALPCVYGSFHTFHSPTAPVLPGPGSHSPRKNPRHLIRAAGKSKKEPGNGAEQGRIVVPSSGSCVNRGSIMLLVVE